MKLNIGRYSIVSILLLTAVIALSISLYQTNRWLRSASAGLSSAWQTRWPDPDNLNALLTTELVDIIDYENQSASANWRVLVPTTGTYCVRWKAGPEASASSVVVPRGFSKIDLKLNGDLGTRLDLEIEVDGTKTVDQLKINSPLIVDPVSFSAAGMLQTSSLPPNRRFPLFRLGRNAQNSQDDFEVWIEAFVTKGMQQNHALNGSSVGPSSLLNDQPTEPR